MKRRIKILLITLLCLTSTFTGVAQTTLSDEELHELYWTYRNRYKLFFTHIGNNKGDCIPISARLDSTTDNGLCDFPNGYIGYGDGTSNLGFYIATLATEYKLLKDANQPVQEVLNELYYAIRTVRRLDENAEPYYNSSLAPTLNGFFMRDDVDSSFHSRWSANNTKMTLADAYMKGAKDANGNCINENFRGPAPEMSKDQFICLLMGFTLVKKFVAPDLQHDIFVKPTPADDGFFIFREISDFTHRYMQFIFNWVQFDITNKCVFATSPFTIHITRNLYLVNPVNGHHIGTDRGGDLADLIYPLCKAAKLLTGVDYMEWQFEYKTAHANSVCLPQVEEHKIKIKDMPGSPGFDVWGLTPFQYNPSAGNIVTISNFNFEAGENNSNMFCPLAAMVPNHWIENDFKFLCNRYGFFEYYLLYAVLQDKPDMKDINFWMQRFSTLDKEVNPYKYDFGNYYAHANSWQHSARASVDEPDGYLNGIDFMLAYNLFKIKYDTAQAIPPSKEASCDCGQPFVERTWNKPDNSLRGEWDWTNPTLKLSTQFAGMGQFQNILSSGTYTVERYHPDYPSKGIKTYSYLSLHDYFVRNSAVLHTKGDVVLCNQKSLYMDDASKLIIGGDLPTQISEFRIRKGAELYLVANSELIIKNNCRLVIEPGALLLFFDNAKITLDGPNAVLEIQGAVSVGANATFNTQGSGYVLFNNYNPELNGQYSIINEAGDGAVNFTGTSVEKKIEIASFTNVMIQDHIPLTLNNITVECGWSSGFKLGCPVSLERVQFNKLPSIPTITIPFTNQVIGKYVHNSLTFYGQPNIVVRQCWFNNARTAIKNIKLPSGGKKLKVLYSYFNTCEKGIETYNGGGNFAGNRFTDCRIGWTDPKTATTTILEHNLFTNITDHAISINTLAGTTGIFGNVFTKNHGSIRASGNAYLFLTCNQFHDNVYNGIYNNSIHLSASTTQPFHQLFTNGTGVNAGNNIFTTGVNNAQSGMFFRDMTYYRFDDGFNFFNNLHTSSPPFAYSITADIKRNVALSGGGQNYGDVDFDNNSFNPQPLLMIPGHLDYNTNPTSKQFDLVFKDFGPGGFIYGTKTSALPTCPIRWQDAIGNPSIFNNYDLLLYEQSGSFPLVKAPGSGLGPGTVTTGTLPPTITTVNSGIYTGTNYKDAALSTLRAIHTGAQDPDVLIINLEALSNLGNLVLSTTGVVSETDKYIWKYLYRSYNAYLAEAVYAGAFTENPVLKEEYLAATIAIDIAALIHNDAASVTDEQERYANKLLFKYNSAAAYAEFGHYTESIATLNNIYGFATGEDLNTLDVMYCITENEKKLFNSEIDRLQFEANTDNCMLLYTEYISEALQQLTDSLNEHAAGGEESQPEFIIYPNPASSSVVVTLDLPYDGSVTVSVYDRYGVKVLQDIIAELPFGQHDITVDISSLLTDMYNMVVFVNGIPYSKNFIKL